MRNRLAHPTVVHRARRGLLTVVAITVIYYVVPPRNNVGTGGRWLVFVVIGGGLVLGTLSARRRLAEYRAGGDWRTIGIESIAVGVLLVAVLFAAIYFALGNDPTQISGVQTKTDALYFSVTTLATVGFGDIHATGQLARGLVTIQMLFDMVFVATAVGLVVSSLSARAQERVRTTRHATQPEESQQ